MGVDVRITLSKRESNKLRNIGKYYIDLQKCAISAIRWKIGSRIAGQADPAVCNFLNSHITLTQIFSDVGYAADPAVKGCQIAFKDQKQTGCLNQRADESKMHYDNQSESEEVSDSCLDSASLEEEGSAAAESDK